jgi:hypothetical protein
LRRGWTKFSPCASAAIAVTVVFVSAAAPAQHDAQHGALPKPYTELTLAGLRPGRDSLAVALKHYKAKYSSSDEGGAAEKSAEKPSEKQWGDPCTGHSLSLNTDAHGVIQKITVSSLVPQDGKCESRRTDALDEMDWGTGQGLHLGDPQDRVAELYGEPHSSGPSVKNGNELEFLFYPFDWAGADVPQSMEIYCARDTGKVVEMTLAYPSL